MTHIAFIGLGIMGLPMAKNLMKAGSYVTGYNRSQPAIDDLVAAGGQGATGVANAVKSADVIITMLPDSPDVEGTVRGDAGVIACAKVGAPWIDNSSIRPDIARQMVVESIASGFGAVDAPLSGGKQGAIDAELSIMVGGSPKDFARTQPVLNSIGNTIVHVGPAGLGQTINATNQLIVAINIQALAEGMAFLEAYGVDTGVALNVLRQGKAGSKVLDHKGQKMLNRDFVPGVRPALNKKDTDILTAAAHKVGINLPLGETVERLMVEAVRRGDGDLDDSALFKLINELNNRS